MKRSGLYLAIVVVFAAAGFILWKFFPSKSTSPSVVMAAKTPEAGAAEKFMNEPIQPIPLSVRLDEKKVSLGNRLFNDTQLSRNNTVSCATCHNLGKGGTDQLPVSRGMDDALGEVNSPTVFNSGFNFKQFWDGRADSLEDQAEGPLHNSKEMDAPQWPELIARLSADPSYAASFRSTYPKDGITEDTVKNAIAEFERSLITPNSRFDRYLRGDESAITDQEKEGYRLFKELGCVVCHQGINVGGNMFQTFGKFGDYFADRGNVQKIDYGRMNVTGLERDRYKFKVPSLRNIELTYPYFHDGTAGTLEKSVQVMAKYQLGAELAQNEVDAITAYLKTLTGEYEGRPLGKQD